MASSSTSCVGSRGVEREDETLSLELREWIAEMVRGRVVQVRRQARWRPNYFVDVDAPGLETVVLKSARAPGHVIDRSALLSTFNSHREAVVLELLQDQHVKVPPYLGFHGDTRSLLMAKVEGSAQVHGIEDRERMRRISRDFAEQLASLHRLAVDDLDLTDDLRVPTDAEELALGNFLRYAETDFDTVLRRRPQLADPLLALARSWVRRRIPPFARPAAVVQGDCGPDQFLFDGDRVTAIIDWELAHIGDPMVDLGAMRLRECLYPAGMFPFVLERYRELGMPVDDQAIRYYTVVTILFTLFGTIGGTVRLDPRNEEVILQLWWQVALRRVLCEAIAEFEGIELTRPEPLDGHDGADVRLHALLADRIHQIARRNAGRAGELRSTLALADAIANEARGRAARAAVNLEDLGACLESAPLDVDEGLRSLGRAIAAGPDDDFERRLETLYRFAVREQEAWLPLMRADRWTEDDGADEDLRTDHEALGLTPY
jgi:aminoglycoside phosphotransferase (APT) family kinase protein